jgi:hypothetical protein
MILNFIFKISREASLVKKKFKIPPEGEKGIECSTLGLWSGKEGKTASAS